MNDAFSSFLILWFLRLVFGFFAICRLVRASSLPHHPTHFPWNHGEFAFTQALVFRFQHLPGRAFAVDRDEPHHAA